ncbi:MAG: radical SAM protein [Desulfobacterales bacterium]|nr:radical SAM protein [Desulfobacterales bacterium]
MTKLLDSYGRTIDYLRISITDRCNLYCLYCTPFGGRKRLSHAEILTFEEILRITKAAVSAGISKIRVTGGEPLQPIQISGEPEISAITSKYQGVEFFVIPQYRITISFYLRYLQDITTSAKFHILVS